MTSWRSVLLPLLLAGSALQWQTATAGTPQMDVRGWLEHMIHAVHNLNYEGTFVYLHDNHLDSMKVLHTVG